MRWLVVMLAVTTLTACATMTAGNAPEPLLFTSRGEVPTVCYVRARGFHGLVPMSCLEAQIVRP